MIKIKQLFDEITKQKVYPITTLKAVKDPKSKKSLSDLMIVGEGEEIIGELGKRDCDTLGGKYKSTDIDSAMTCDEDEELGVVEDVTIVDADRLGGKYTADDIDTMFSNCYAKLKVIGETGCIVTLSDGQSGVIDASGSIVFSVYYGEYTVQVTKGGSTSTYTVTIDTLKIYELAVVGFNITNWLRAGKISTDYASVSEIPEKDIRQLMTIHASVDYLVENINEVCVDVATELLNNDICAKWINLRDYALDMLYTNPVAKSIMDRLGKYGYGEWELLPQVPTMTSNTSPYGEAFADAYSNSGYDKYMAFDENTGTRWSAGGAHSYEGTFIGYKFTKKTKVNGLYIDWFEDTNVKVIRGNDAIVQASDDNVNWIDIAVCELGLTYSGTGHAAKNWRFENDKSFLYWRIKPASAKGFTDWTCWKLQFYAWGAKGAVPVMTSNTAPYGTASASSISTTNNDAYHAFIFDYVHRWQATQNTANSWLRYNFVNPVCAKRVLIDGTGTTAKNTCKTATIQASNDGTNWVDLLKNFDTTNLYFDLDNDNYYLYYRVIAHTTENPTWYSIWNLQFYGRQLNVSVPTMTGNTAPWGETLSSTVYVNNVPATNFNPWRAFDKNLIDDDNTPSFVGIIEELPNVYVGYDFGKKVSILKFAITQRYMHTVQNFKEIIFEYSDDKISWHPASDDIVAPQNNSGSPTQLIYDSAENEAHRYWRVRIKSVYGVSDIASVLELQFYGVDYSEREFEEGSTMKYIYDHGVELEEVKYISQNNTGSLTKNENELVFKAPSTSSDGSRCSMYVENINTNLFKLGRAVISAMTGEIGMSVTTTLLINATCWKIQQITDLPNNLYVNCDSMTTTGYAEIRSDRSPCSINVLEWWLE